MRRTTAPKKPDGCGEILDFAREGHLLGLSLTLPVAPEIKPEALKTMSRQFGREPRIETLVVLFDRDAMREDDPSLRCSLSLTVDSGESHPVS